MNGIDALSFTQYAPLLHAKISLKFTLNFSDVVVCSLEPSTGSYIALTAKPFLSAQCLGPLHAPEVIIPY